MNKFESFEFESWKGSSSKSFTWLERLNKNSPKFEFRPRFIFRLSEGQTCWTHWVSSLVWKICKFSVSKWELECSPIRNGELIMRKWCIQNSDQCTYRNLLDRNDRDTNYHYHNHHYFHFKQMLNFLALSTMFPILNFHLQRSTVQLVFVPFFFIELKFCWRDSSFSGCSNFGCRLSILAKFESFARFLGILILNSHTHYMNSPWSNHYFLFKLKHSHIWWFLSLFCLLCSVLVFQFTEAILKF